MPHTALVTLTAKPLEQVLADGGSRDWRLDPVRARQAEYLVCTQNHANPAFGSQLAPHRAAFLIGRISGVVPSSETADRWLVKISEYTTCNIPNIWAKSGPLRYPIWYTTLEELGIDLTTLPPFRPLSSDSVPTGVAEAPARPLTPPPHAVSPMSWAPQPADDGAWARFDAILRQFDRIADQGAPFDALAWDAHGLPA